MTRAPEIPREASHEQLFFFFFFFGEASNPRD